MEDGSEETEEEAPLSEHSSRAQPLHCLPSQREGSPVAAAMSSTPSTSLQSFAKVYHAHNVLTGQSVTVKVINKKKLRGTSLMSKNQQALRGPRLQGIPTAQALHSHCTPIAHCLPTRRKGSSGERQIDSSSKAPSPLLGFLYGLKGRCRWLGARLVRIARLLRVLPLAATARRVPAMAWRSWVLELTVTELGFRCDSRSLARILRRISSDILLADVAVEVDDKGSDGMGV